MKENIYFRSMHIYTLHRSDEIDHVNGRPAILLWFKQNKSLIWAGTTKKDNKTKEMPLIMTLNKIKTYFYSTGIERIENKFIKSVWIDFETYSVYQLTIYEQQKLISKFVSFTLEQDPYIKIKNLEIKIEELELKLQLKNKEIQQLKNK